MGTCLLLLPLVPAIYVGSTGMVEVDIETDVLGTLGDQGTLVQVLINTFTKTVNIFHYYA